MASRKLSTGTGRTVGSWPDRVFARAAVTVVAHREATRREHHFRFEPRPPHYSIHRQRLAIMNGTSSLTMKWLPGGVKEVLIVD